MWTPDDFKIFIGDFCGAMKNKFDPWYGLTKQFQYNTCPIIAGVSYIYFSKKSNILIATAVKGNFHHDETD